MSGRVRWRPFTDEPRCGRMLCVGPLRVGDVVPDGDGWAATVYGTDERETSTRRRSDAKRWLLARAAGLAEVPRRGNFGTRYGSPQCQVVTSCGPEGIPVPRGWRVADAYVSVNEQTIVTLERNRRRR